MRFEEALQAMRDGRKVTRAGWCDGEYIVLSTLPNRKTNPLMDEHENSVHELATINLFADDWQIVEGR